MEVAQNTVISSTYWTDRIGPTAAIANINKMKDNNVAEHLIRAGKKVKDLWGTMASKHDIEIEISGIDPLGHFDFKYKNPLVIKTLLTQLMLEKGFLASNGFYASYAIKMNSLKNILMPWIRHLPLSPEQLRKEILRDI